MFENLHHNRRKHITEPSPRKQIQGRGLLIRPSHNDSRGLREQPEDNEMPLKRVGFGSEPRANTNPTGRPHSPKPEPPAVCIAAQSSMPVDPRHQQQFPISTKAFKTFSEPFCNTGEKPKRDAHKLATSKRPHKISDGETSQFCCKNS